METAATDPGIAAQDCALCGSAGCAIVLRDRRRSYLHCPACDLVFVPRAELIPIDEERARYAWHHNTADHPVYQTYVDECVRELGRLPLAGRAILDFGCGEHAVLSGRLCASGLDCTPYDPVYGIGAEALSRNYDVIVAIETVEHLREPGREFERLARLLAPGGHLVVRTLLRDDGTDLRDWWYKNDSTHVNFFSERTMRHLAGRLGLDWVFCDGRQLVILGQPR